MSRTERSRLAIFCAVTVAALPACCPRLAGGAERPRTQPASKPGNQGADEMLRGRAERLMREGQALADKGQFAEAETKYLIALVIYTKLYARRDHPAVAMGLRNLGVCNWQLGRRSDAVKMLTAAVEMQQRVYGARDHLDRVNSLENLGACLVLLGRPADALARLEAALGMCQRICRNQENPLTARLLGNVAFCLRRLGRSAEALGRAEEALAMTKRLCEGQDQPILAERLHEVASCLSALGRPSEALPQAQAALGIYQRLCKDRPHPRLATTLGTLGYCLLRLGRAPEALAKYEAALAMSKRLHRDRDHRSVAANLNNQGSCLRDLGRPQEALGKFQAALAMWKRLSGGRGDPDVAGGLNNVAGCLKALGRMGRALPNYEAALAMLRRIHAGRDHPEVAITLDNVGVCLMHLGQPAEALPMYEAALAMFRRIHKGRDHPDVVTALNNLASCQRRLGEPSKALSNYEAGLAMRKRLAAGRDHPEVATALNNLASCLRGLGQANEALPKYQAALAMRRRIFPDGDHPDVAESLNSLGACLESLDRDAEALANYQAAVAMAERLDSPDALRWANNLGWLYLEDLRQPAEAAAAFAKSIAGVEQARARVGGSDVDRVGYFAKIHRMGAFEGMMRAQLRLARPDKALEYAERGRALGLRDLLERGKRLHGGDLLGPVEAAARQRGDQALLREAAQVRRRERGAFQKIGTLIARINLTRRRRDLDKAGQSETIRRLSAELAAARAEHLAARRVVFNLAGTHAVPSLRPPTAGRIQAFLPAGQMLLMYGVGVDDTLLLVVPPAGGKVRGFSLKWPDGRAVAGAVLGKEVRRYVSGMQVDRGRSRGVKRPAPGRHDSPKQAALGYRLFRALVPAGLWRELRSAEQVYIVPDGVLHRLPFEALLVSPPPEKSPSAGRRRYWLDAGPALIYGPSAAVLANRRARRDQQLRRLARGEAHRRQAVLLGDPIFDRRAAPATTKPARRRYAGSFGALASLPGTREEVLRIYRTLTGKAYTQGSADPRVAILLGEDATRGRLFQAAAGCRYLHLATHGLLDTGERAIYSSLALTQPRTPTPEDFGFLTLVDLFDNWYGQLGVTELVVLSACDTHRGRIEAGEGVFGISWGFLYAGAPAVIASLWQVSDESTAEMMGELYGAISKQTAAGASAAKLRAFVGVRKALRRKHPEPYFWAPFIYIGDPR